LWATEIPLMVRVAAGSLTVPVTVTGLRLVTLRFAGEVIETLGAGAYVSESGELLVFPATSVACTEMEFAPWVSSTEQVKFGPEMAAGEPLQVTVDTPDKLSPSLPLRPRAIVLKLIVDPLDGDAIATVGGVLSSLM